MYYVSLIDNDIIFHAMRHFLHQLHVCEIQHCLTLDRLNIRVDINHIKGIETASAKFFSCAFNPEVFSFSVIIIHLAI